MTNLSVMKAEVKNIGGGASLGLLEEVKSRLRPEGQEGASNDRWERETSPGRGCVKGCEA